MSGRPVIDLPGARVAITGTSRGLGRALAGAFAAAGAHLVLHARRADDVAAAASLATDRGAPAVEAVAGDLLDPATPVALAAAARRLGGLDLLILSAGVLGPMGPLRSTEDAAVRHVLEVNVTAQVALVRATLPLLTSGGGAVMWLSSGLGRFGLPDYGAYCASKHAVEGLMKVLAEEHREDGLVSVAVAPGMVQTDMLRAALRTADVSEHPTPEATAAAFVRLARDLTPDHSGASLDIEPWLAA